MQFNAHKYRDCQLARRIASWVVVLVLFAGLSTVPANAGLITCVQPVAESEFAELTVEALIPFDALFSRDSVVFCDPRFSSTTSDLPRKDSTPAAPTQPPQDQVIFDGLVDLGTSSGAGSGSGPSNVGGGSASTVAVFQSASKFAPPKPVGRLYMAELLDIPPAPPFELLRPPKVFTTLL